MSILGRLSNRILGRPDDYSPDELRKIWNIYCDQWPDNHERYRCWKPESILPASKASVKHAMKLCYAEWPEEPVSWSMFGCFFMEFADLALHLPQDDYDAIQTFRRSRLFSCGKEVQRDPLSTFYLTSTLAFAESVVGPDHKIIYNRDGLRRSSTWDPVDVSDTELDVVRRIIMTSTVEFATLTQEWRFYILSIGRDQYVRDS